MRDINLKWLLLFIALFLLYAFVRVSTNPAAIERPRETADTTAYLRISRWPVLNVEFWGSTRPFVFPLLLKVSKQDLPAAAEFQLGFSILAWGLFALAVSASLRTVWLKPFAFGLILALSLVRHIASWDFVMLTESLSISWFVLFLTMGIWLLNGWRTDKVIALIVTGFFLAFTRDTNSYLLLALAGLILLAVILLWLKPRALLIAASFALIFVLNNASANLGQRWVFPLNNLIGRRILPNPQVVDFFESCGMPVTAELMRLEGGYANADDRAFYNDPSLDGYRAWLRADGKTCYTRWLLSDPIHSVGESLAEFEGLIAFDKVDSFFSRRYEPVLPWRVERLLYPTHFTLWLFVALMFASVVIIWKRAWHGNRLWAAYLLLCVPILPHLFISWHGDAMAPERHALSVGLQLALSFWILVFLIADQIFRHIFNKKVLNNQNLK
jgi:hypothetical protein